MPALPKAKPKRPQVEQAPPEAPGDGAAPAAAQPPSPVLPVLPTEKTVTAGVLETKTVLLYGPAGIGKSTLASEWAGGDMLFFDTAGELEDLSVYRIPVTDFETFRAGCIAYAAEMAKPEPAYAGAVIDTADMLGTYCAQHVRSRLGVVHQSDAEWGKGWDLLKEAFLSYLARLSALPGGLILISHSRESEIKTRSESYNRLGPTLTGGVRDACVNTADLVLLVDYDEDGENRVIKTKPGKYHEAKERGRAPRLPAEIPWPIGQSGYDILRAAWHNNDNEQGGQ